MIDQIDIISSESHADVRRMKRSQKNTEKIKRPSSDKSKDVLCHALLTPLSSVRREEKKEGKRKEVKTTINNKTKQQREPG